MENECFVPKMRPKGEVLRRAAQRYPELEVEAIEVFLSIQRVAQESDCATREELELYGLSEGRFYVLADLFAEELLGHDATSPSEIAEHLGVTRATITGLLDGLERDDFLERRHDSRDRRALTIHMTNKARRFLDEFLPRSGKRFTTRISGLSGEERQTLIVLLSKIGAAPTEAAEA